MILIAVAAISATAGALYVGRSSIPLFAMPGAERCEQSIMAGLRSPSTFKRIKITTADEGPFDYPGFARAAALDVPTKKPEAGSLRDTIAWHSSQLDQERDRGHQLTLRRMFVEYDADNAFGAPIRGTSECLFKLRDGKMVPDSELRDRSSDARMAELTEQMTAGGYDTRELRNVTPKMPKHLCCL